MSIPIEDIGRSAADMISSKPSFYLSLIFCNGPESMMEKIKCSFSKRLDESNSKLSLVKLNGKGYNLEELIKEKERNLNTLFIIYDGDSSIYRRDKALISRSYSIDIDACEKLFTKNK